MEFMDFGGDSEEVKRLKSFYDNVARGDFTSARQHLEPTVEWIGPEAPGLWFGGVHRGPDAIFKEVVEPAYGRIADFRVKIKRFYEVGDHIIAVGRATGRTKMTGRELDTPVVHVWTVRNGKFTQCQTYHDVPKWLEALGQTPPQEQQQRQAA